MDLHPDLTDFLTALESSHAEYLVVGGWAVSIHAEPRYTKDLDLFIGPSPENLQRVVHALGEYGAPKGLVDEVASMTVEEFVFFGVPPARIDLLRAIPGVEFAQAWSRRKTLVWKQTKVNVLGFDDLCAAKKAAGRRKDLDDLATLRKFAKKR